MRTLIFGVDGLTFRVLHPLMQAGYLPHFQALARDGVETVLESKYPPFTPPQWMSLATGQKPAKHGVYDFWEYDEEGGYRLMTGRKGGEAIWNLASACGKRVIVLNVPLTYPPEPVNGIFVSGFPGASERGNFTYPAAFREELFAHVPDYRIDIDHNALNHGQRSHADEVVLVTEKRLALMRYLLREKEWDFAFVVYRLSDHIQHKRWPEIMALKPDELRYYHLLDEALGEARAAVGPDGQVFVVSDHGFQGTHSVFAINEYLYQHHWLQTKRNQQRGLRLLEATAKLTLNQLGILYRVRQTKRHLFPPSEKATSRMFPYLTWAELRAAGVCMPSWSGTAGGYAVLRVSRPLSEQALADLRGELLELHDPATGQQLLDGIYSTAVFGEGPYQPRDECLLLLASDGYTFTPVLGRPWLWEHERRIFGTHQTDGVLYACGPGIRAGMRGLSHSTAQVYDVLPTVLHAMNLPVPEGLDGQVLHEIFSEHRPATAQRKTTQATVARKLDHLLRS